MSDKITNAISNKKININYISVFCRILLVFAFAIVIYYMLGPSEGYLHSDCVDTITWAVGSAEDGKMLSPTFSYPCLLPFGATSTMLPFVQIFGFTMLAYRLSMITFMLLFTTALYFALRGMGWNKNLCIATVAVELIMVSSSQKLREMFWEHIIYYSLGAFLALVLLALVFAFIAKFNKNKQSFKNNKISVVLLICIGVWSFFSAFDGMTVLALATLPVIGALIIETYMDNSVKIVSRNNAGVAVTLLMIIVTTVAGLLVFSALASGIETGYANSYSNIVGNEEWSQNMLNFLRHWTSLLGADYKTGEAITKGANILAAVKMAGSLVLFVTPFYPLVARKKFSKNERIFTYYHWVMTAFILYGFVFGNISSSNWRLTPIVCSAVVVNIMVWKKLWAAVDTRRTCVALSSLIILSCVITAGQIISMPPDYGRDNDLHKAVELLEKNDLDYGYATYWNANILTLLSSSKVRVRDVNIDEDEPRKGWLNADSTWFDDQPGQDKYFFLLTNGEYDSAVERNHVILEDTEKIIREGNWVVLVKNENIF